MRVRARSNLCSASVLYLAVLVLVPRKKARACRCEETRVLCLPTFLVPAIVRGGCAARDHREAMF